MCTVEYTEKFSIKTLILVGHMRSLNVHILTICLLADLGNKPLSS